MAVYESKTIADLIQDIEKGRVVLPAMQRNFVWSEDKICRLFESLMRDYPIGTFLFWMIDKEIFKKYVFNTFIRDYDEQLGKMQRGNRATSDYSDYTAVLDGQQRITSLYMGTRGKYRTHIKGKEWGNPNNYFDRYLCIDVLFVPEGEDEYHFAFLPENQIEKLEEDGTGNKHFWIKVARVFAEKEVANIPDISDGIPEGISHALRVSARKTLTKLHNALRQVYNVNYYPAKNEELIDVIDIFVRVNSGGEKLDSSDLMLSVATAAQGDVDIHVKIQDAVDEINNAPIDIEKGFKADKELLLTAGLYFTGADSISLKNGDNYSQSRMNEVFKDHWEATVDALKCTVEYIEYLGFVGKKISRNVILPVAYYFYKNQITPGYKNSVSKRAVCDRVFIRQWLLRAIINGVFIDGTGSTLLSIRRIIDKTNKTHFPLEDLMQAEIKKPLSIDNNQIEEIMDIKYGDSRIIPLFNELEHVAARPNDEVDHIWARAILSSKKAIKKLYPSITESVLEQYKDKLNCIANLQLLDAVDNREKNDTPFSDWIVLKYPNPTNMLLYKTTRFIPEDCSYDFADFLTFIEKREKLLREKIQEAFPSDFNKIVERYSLQNKLS